MLVLFALRITLKVHRVVQCSSLSLCGHDFISQISTTLIISGY